MAKVLIIDDDADIVHMLRQVLEDEHYTVLQSIGEAAVALAETEQPGAVLLDIMMPGLSGVEICRRLRANPRTASIPVVAMSASHRLQERAAEMVVEGLLAKPFDLDDLLRTVARLTRIPPSGMRWDDGSAAQQ